MNARVAKRFEGIHCELIIERPRSAWSSCDSRDRTSANSDTVPSGDSEVDVAKGDLELFVDARCALGPSTDVSGQWAAWLRLHRDKFRHVSMLTGSQIRSSHRRVRTSLWRHGGANEG